MKKYLFLALTLLCAGGLIAQKNVPEVIPGPGDGNRKQSFAPKQSEVPAKNSKSPAPKQNSEEDGVVIDSKSEGSEAETSTYSSENNSEQQADAGFASSLPASYGKLKGVLNEPGRNVLVFENEEGILSFVQVSLGRSSLTWKLLARAGRSQD